MVCTCGCALGGGVCCYGVCCWCICFSGSRSATCGISTPTFVSSFLKICF
ncbi:hypothetical protein HBZS_112220 [Helicobacter bizzozeronii CCUG 35545]|nr:hypothetical protein HBZS_112220 [Helicobacter bizzozeronii CCUG 35545]